MRYVVFGVVTAASFVVASVIASIITTNLQPDRPGDLKQPIERRIGDPPKPSTPATTTAPKPKDEPKPDPKPEPDPEPEPEPEVVPAVSRPQPAQSSRTWDTRPQAGPGNLDRPAPATAPRGPGNLDAHFAPSPPINQQIGPGNL